VELVVRRRPKAFVDDDQKRVRVDSQQAVVEQNVQVGTQEKPVVHRVVARLGVPNDVRRFQNGFGAVTLTKKRVNLDVLPTA
jgi:hypothetical protein